MKILRCLVALLGLGLVLCFKIEFSKQISFSSNLKDNFVTFTIETPRGENKNEKLNLYYHDSLAYGHPVNIGITGKKILLNYPTFLFQANEKQTPFLIFPGEKINIRYMGTDSIQMYIIGNMQRTNELNFFRRLVQKTGNLYYTFKKPSYLQTLNSIEELEVSNQLIGKVKKARLSFLSSYVEQFSTDTGFDRIALNAIKSTAFNDSLLLVSNNKGLLNMKGLYRRFIIDKSTAITKIGYMPFQFYLRACNTLSSMYLYGEESHIMRNEADFVKSFNFSSNLKNITKDFYMSRAIVEALANNIDVPKNFIDIFHKDCKNEGYKVLIDNKLLDKQKSVSSIVSDELALLNGKTIGLKTVILRNKGKLVLLDFWASWCAPCRAEMPYYKTLKKKYSDREIVFISISEDQDRNNWLIANREESLGEYDSFLLLKVNNSSFVKEFNISSIPRYLLIGKDGKTINDNTPRPSDPKLKGLIDSNLY